MKLQKLFTFAIMMFAALTAMTNTASAQSRDKNWMVFTGYQTVAIERRPVAAKFTCADSIYATANFAAPVDLSDGFYVTMAENGKVIVQEKMTVDNAGERRSIPVQIVPDDDAEVGFPEATLDYSRTLLTELKAGVHTVAVAVSVGEGDDEIISAGTFTLDNRRGCAERFERVDNLINGSPTVETETTETEVEQTEDDTDTPVVPTRPQTQQPTRPQTQTQTTPERREEPRPEPVKPAEDPEVEIYNSCGDTRYIQIERPNGSNDNLNFHGSREFHRYPLGTKIYVIVDGNKELIDTVVANPSNTSYGKQQIKLCQ